MSSSSKDPQFSEPLGSRAWLTDILNSQIAALASLHVFPNRHWECSYFSPGCEPLFGYSPEALMADRHLWLSRVPQEDVDSVLVPLLDAVFAECSQAPHEYRFVRADGSLRWVMGNLSSRWDNDIGAWVVISVATDISDRKQLEITLQRQLEQEHLLRTITTHVRQSLDFSIILSTTVNEVQQTLQADRTLIFRLLSNGSGQVIQEAVCPSYPMIDKMMWLDECFPEACYEYYRQGQGRIVPDVAQDTWAECLSEFMAEVGVKSKIVAPIVSLRDSRAPHLWGLLIVHACREYRQWQTSEAQFLQQLADQLAIAIQQAVLYEQLWQANQQLQHLATHDALTQVANRRTFNEHLNQEWLRLAREQRPLALIFADIDYFKQYNDTYGHPAGDVCLTAVAQTLSQTLKRPADFIARYGGEEFVIVLPNTRAQGAVKLVQTIQAEIERLNFPHAGSALAAQRITLSFGITWTIPLPTEAAQSLLERADQALYQAKNQGRDRYVVLAH